MTIARTTGAFVGASESAGVGIAAGATYTGGETDLLGGTDSTGTINLYCKFSTAATLGSLVITCRNNRVSGQAHTDPGKTFVVPAGQSGNNVFLGRFAVSRYMSVTVKNRLVGATANAVAVLYELEKTT